MELGFKVLAFRAFDQILGLGPEGLPAPAQLKLGEIENTQTNVIPFDIYVMIEKLAIIDGTLNQYIFAAKSIRVINKKFNDRRLIPRNPQTFFSPIYWETALGVFDRETRFGAIELSSSASFFSQDKKGLTKTITLRTNRLIDRVNSVRHLSHP